MSRVVGIDLGTTFSSVAYVNSLGKPEIILNREGESITPSVVMFQGDQPLVGSMAKRAAISAPFDTVQFVKRSMGDPTWRFVSSDGGNYTAEEVSAIILKRLKEDAELALDEPVTHAVITVPAYFDDARRRATIDAGRIAGLEVLRVLNEPTAAALAFGVDGEVDGTLLVFDLGGGTFDVTVMKVNDGAFDVIATDGDRNLGGFDWDNKLMEWVNDQVKADGGQDLFDDDVATADLRDKVELAKRSLTSVPKTNLILMSDGSPKTISITREAFEEVTAPLLARTRRLTEAVLEDSELTWADIDRVLLVGGSTRMPMVPAMIEELSGKTIERTLNPDEAVALGAAIQASITVAANEAEGGEAGIAHNVPGLGSGAPIVINDVTSQALGIIALDSRDARFNSIIIPRNHAIPAQASERYKTIADHQARLKIEVTQGDDADPEFVTVVGEQILDLPPYPKGAPLRVTFSYDIDQIIHIEVFDETSQRSLGSFEVDNEANMSVSDVQIASDRLTDVEVF
ncbi:MAG: Hsp70 family protein [Actinomycetes bacterium]